MPTAKKPVTKKQKQSLISKLKLNTLKGRILATVLVFAVIGGGLAVYRSFAASQTTYYPGSFRAASTCGGLLTTDVKKDAAGNKNTVAAYRLSPDVGSCGDGRIDVFPQISVSFGSGTTTGSDRATFCAEVKAVNGAKIWISNPSSPENGTDIDLASSLNTQSVCSSERAQKYTGIIVLHNKSTGALQDIYVHKLYVDIGPYGPAPAPTK